MNIPLKQKIHRWFEFLRLAHQSADPVVIANLKSSKDFYEPWGDYLNTSFTRWWLTHRHLFRTVSAMRKMNASDVVDDSAMFLVIPYTYAPTSVAKIVQRMYTEEQARRADAVKKVKKVYGGSFGLTTDEFQVSQFVYYHRFAKDVFLPLNASGVKVTTKRYVDAAKKSFAKQRLVTSWEDTTLARRRVPFKDSSDVYANQSKRARDFVRIVQNILRNVSLGQFPGDYLTAGVKNQAEQRRISPIYPVRKQKRGVAQSRYQSVVERDKPFNVYSETSKKIY
jgi:hypothetical protein